MGQYFGFSGRASRLQYWMTSLFAFALWVGFGVFVASRLPGHGPTPDKDELARLLVTQFTVPFIVLFVLTCWLNISCVVRRYHDRDKSGIWYLVVLIPYIGGLWQFVECGFLRGTDGINSYGPPAGSGSFDAGRVYAEAKSSAADYGDVDAKIARMKQERMAQSAKPQASAQAAPGRSGPRNMGSGFGKRGLA
jgi:uncharacterized membrane protein YhaH (DUF805 family)